MTYIEVEEEQPCRVDARLLTEEAALRLHRRFHHLLDLAFPNPLHPNHYLLRSRGWVGQLALGALCIDLKPKVPLGNLFAMIEEAYGVAPVQFSPGVVHSGTVPQIFCLLASLLAQGTLARLHQGLYREYREYEDELGCVRGRVLFLPGRRPGVLRCAFQEHSPSIPDNQILLWTLHLLRAFAFADPEANRQVQLAHRLLGGMVESAPVRAEDCVGRRYHRLNREYASMHGLCRFFLEHRGPVLGPGVHALMPFAVHLPTLFERFVARWLESRLPRRFHLEAQHRAPLEGSQGLSFHIDLVLRDGERGKALAVLDTKYKTSGEAASEDLQQVVAYAVRMGTTKAFLVYPSTAIRRRRIRVGEVQVETLGFELAGELQTAGDGVLEAVVARINGA